MVMVFWCSKPFFAIVVYYLHTHILFYTLLTQPIINTQTNSRHYDDYY